jgi:uncharacterized membrane protein
MEPDPIFAPEPDELLQEDSALRWPLVAIRVLALAAAGIAGYLLAVSFTQRGLPLGCGAGSGCDEVLRSRWSNLFGIPVGAFALAAYLAAFLATFAVGLCRGRAAWSLLLMIAVSVVGAALWFVSLQLFAMQAICPWCMADHALGVTMAGIILWTAHDVARRGGPQAPKLGGPLGAGIAATCALIGLQFVFGTSSAKVARLPSGQNEDSGPGPDRQISMLSGQLILDVHELPVLGSPDAPHVLVLLYDYCCPHCRATHGYLLEGLKRYPNQYGILLLPLPLDSECNPKVPETDPRFEESCELARLALGVWRARPEAFAEFDAWLYEPETPRTLAEARARAEQAVTAAALDAALADPWIADRISSNVSAFAVSGAQTIPLVVSPKVNGVVGRPESAEELHGILEHELGLKPAVP